MRGGRVGDSNVSDSRSNYPTVNELGFKQRWTDKKTGREQEEREYTYKKTGFSTVCSASVLKHVAPFYRQTGATIHRRGSRGWREDVHKVCSWPNGHWPATSQATKANATCTLACEASVSRWQRPQFARGKNSANIAVINAKRLLRRLHVHARHMSKKIKSSLNLNFWIVRVLITNSGCTTRSAV